MSIHNITPSDLSLGLNFLKILLKNDLKASYTHKDIFRSAEDDPTTTYTIPYDYNAHHDRETSPNKGNEKPNLRKELITVNNNILVILRKKLRGHS